MTLADIEVPTEAIHVGKSSFTVRGISFYDLSLLINDNRADLDRLVDLFAGLKANVEMDQFGVQLIREMPALVARVIACAADEPEAAGKILKFPLPVQLAAVMAVGRLTFEEAGGVKKFAEQLASLLESVNQAVPDLLGSQSLSVGEEKAGA